MCKEGVMTKKFDLQAILTAVRKNYAKDQKSQDMLTTGDSVKQAYETKDGVPLPKDTLLNDLVSLPCLPYNKIIQVAGDADTGKSTICGQVMATAQKTDHIVVLWDAEDKFDANRFDKFFKGNSKELFMIKSNEILQGGEKVRKLIVATKDHYPDAKILFVWDSVGSSQSRSHAERELDSDKHGQPGQDAKENGQVMKMLVALFNKYPDSISVLLANQVYAKIGFMAHGNAQSGGKKIEFHSSFIVELKRLKVLTRVTKGVKVKYGILSRATVKKNHLSQMTTSVYQMDFEITSDGANPSKETIADGDEDE